MRVRNSLALAALAVMLLAPTAVSARNGNADAVKAADAAVLAYWTPERIANAKFRDYVRDAKGNFQPNAGKPGGGGGGNVTGASWTGGSAITQLSGRILFSSGGSDWICSGSLVNDNGAAGAVILTAGHCVFDGADGWSYNFLYMPNFDVEPNYDCGRQNGCWRADRLVANKVFVDGGGFGTNQTVAVDYGFAHVGARLNGTAQADAAPNVGYGLNTGVLSNTEIKWAFGYPAEGRYKGKDLIYCKGPTINDPNGAATWGVGCNMNGGSSGGPWVWNTTDPGTFTSATKLTSVNSYGYSGLTYMFGPKFNTTTQAIATDASDGSQSNGTDYVCVVGTTENTSCPG